MARAWRSSRPRRATDVTLTTQLSVERLYMLEQQCTVGGWEVGSGDGGQRRPPPSLLRCLHAVRACVRAFPTS